MKNITLLAFVDGSAHTLTICEYAALLSQSSKSLVKLYHIIENPIETERNDFSGALNLGARTKLMGALVSEGEKKSKAAIVQGRKILDEAKDKLVEFGCLNVELRLRTGDIAEALKSKEAGGDVVLIGKRGQKSSLKKHRIGNNFERIVRASTKPLFVANSTFKRINNVLVAYDGSIPSKRILKYLLDDTVFGNIAISVLSVSRSTKDRLDLKYKPSILNLNKNNLPLNFINATGDPLEQIMARLDNSCYDMLAIGAYGHSKLRNLFIGSTTSNLIHASPVPVLLSK